MHTECSATLAGAVLLPSGIPCCSFGASCFSVGWLKGRYGYELLVLKYGRMGVLCTRNISYTETNKSAQQDGLIVLNAKYGTPEAINQAEAQEREEPTGIEVRQDASQDPSSTQQQGDTSPFSSSEKHALDLKLLSAA